MKKSILLLAFVAVCGFSQAQKVTLFSGTPDPDNPSCDVGGSGTYPLVATYGQPWGLATDTNGNIYVSENYNSRIRIILSYYSLVYSRVGSAACPPAVGLKDAASSSALFNSPAGIAVGPNNKLYVADQLNNCIRVVDAYSNAGNAQSVVTLAGNATSGYADGTGAAAAFDYPSDVAVDKNGNVYVADLNNNCIRKITPAGVVTTFAGTNTSGYKDGSASVARFSTPWGLCFDNNGDLLVADFGNYRIRKVNVATSPVGDVSTVAGNGQQTVKDGSSTACSFNSAYDLVVDKNGNIYIVEGDASHVIRKIDGSGNVSTIAGKFNDKDTVNGVGANAKFYTPTGLTLSKDQKSLFVADAYNQTIRRIDISSFTPTIDFAANKTTIKAGDTVNFTNQTSVTTGTTYTWAITPGTANTDWKIVTGTSTSQDISVKFLTKGTYNVAMTANNTAWGTKTVTKNALVNVTTGIEYIPFTGLDIYPNPNNGDKLFIDSKEYPVSQVQIIDIQGKTLATINCNGARNFSLDVANLEKGLYIIKTTSGDMTNLSKVIIQ
ncbi:MAG: T9SS type A sorting domain-containing protein [Bacteroidetes bacterium]|nr:T9SS type A sorting domain-containing protein [Bacteroidota bacterium]